MRRAREALDARAPYKFKSDGSAREDLACLRVLEQYRQLRWVLDGELDVLNPRRRDVEVLVHPAGRYKHLPGSLTRERRRPAEEVGVRRIRAEVSEREACAFSGPSLRLSERDELQAEALLAPIFSGAHCPAHTHRTEWELWEHGLNRNDGDIARLQADLS